MMNNKIMMSGLSIMTALTLMAGSAYAAFVSQASSTGNTFSVGNADLQIATDSQAYGSSITGFTGSNLAPGVPQEFTFYLRNHSASAITLDTVAKLGLPGGATDLSGVLQVSFSCTNGSGSDTTTDAGPFTVDAWVAGQAPIGSLPQNDVAFCKMIVELPSSAGNELAGESIVFDGLFNANQATPSPSPLPTL